MKHRIGVTPIVVITRNRASLLDGTLSSLSASLGPTPLPLMILDDFSHDPAALAYLYSHGRRTEHGIDQAQPRGVSHGAVQVLRTNRHLGISMASLLAIEIMSSRASRFFVIQDDVLFTRGWHAAMLAWQEHTNAAVVAGVAFGAALRRDGFAQAQCLLFRGDCLPAYLNALRSRCATSPHRGFDTALSSVVAATGLTLSVTVPHVCQHVGKESLVRPWRRYERKGGRFSRSLTAPLCTQKSVRAFPPVLVNHPDRADDCLP